MVLFARYIAGKRYWSYSAKNDETLVRRLTQALAVVEKENHRLQAVKGRLFGVSVKIDEKWLKELLSGVEGEDRLESFGAKFARMQDTMIDKLPPRLLAAAGEKPGAAIDNLNRAERLGLIHSASQWIGMRRLRNKMAYEYIESDEEMLPALMQAFEFSAELERAYFNCVKYHYCPVNFHSKLS